MNLQKNPPPSPEEQREEEQEQNEVPILEQRPIQADTCVTGTEKTVTRPIQALLEIILLSREIPLEKEPTRGKHTSKRST